MRCLVICLLFFILTAHAEDGKNSSFHGGILTCSRAVNLFDGFLRFTGSFDVKSISPKEFAFQLTNHRLAVSHACAELDDYKPMLSDFVLIKLDSFEGALKNAYNSLTWPDLNVTVSRQYLEQARDVLDEIYNKRPEE